MVLYLQKQIPVIGSVLPKAIRMGLLVFFTLPKPVYVLLGDETTHMPDGRMDKQTR